MRSSGNSAETGTVTISPNHGRAGAWGTWVVTYSAGAQGIATGGGIAGSAAGALAPMVAQPRHAACRVLIPPRRFMSPAHTDWPGARLHYEILDASDAEYVKPLRRNVGYPPGSRYAWTVSVTVTEGELQAGDTINVVYGDMSGGGRGFTPPLWTGSPDRVRAAVDPKGDGAFTLLPDGALPWLNNEPGLPVELLLVLESRSVVGRKKRVRMVALDEFHNPVPAPDTAIYLAVETGAASRFRQTPSSLGVQVRGGVESLRSRLLRQAYCACAARPTTEDCTASPIQARSLILRQNRPIRPQRASIGATFTPTASTPGTAPAHGDDHFRYARYASLLDFYSATDHNDRRSMSQEDWQQNVAYTEKWYTPGAFATILGYEASFGAPYGHHNVYFRGGEGALRYQRRGEPGRDLAAGRARESGGRVAHYPPPHRRFCATGRRREARLAHP